MGALQADDMFACLDRHGVRYVLIGAAFLRNIQLLNLVSRFGDLDLAFRPSGTEGFSDLTRGAVEVTVRGVRVAVAALEDVIRSKEAANRPKDLRTLPVLRQLLEEIKTRRGRRPQ